MPSSLAVLLPPASGFSPHPPVSVYGTGAMPAIAAFLGTRSARFPTYCFGPRHASGSPGRASLPAPRALAPVFSLPGRALRMRPRSSGAWQCRNLHLLSIGYAFLPRLRPRLPQGRSASPWKPWIFGRKDSHLPLATHSGILPPCQSTLPSGSASARQGCSPTDQYVPISIPQLRRRISAPDIFGAGPLDQ